MMTGTRPSTPSVDTPASATSPAAEQVLAILDALLSASDDACAAAIDSALAWMGTVTGADLICIYETCELVGLRNTHAWSAAGLTPGDNVLHGALMAPGDACWTRLQEGVALVVPDVTALPEADDLRDTLEARDIKALVALPLDGAGNFRGLIGCAVLHGSHRTLRTEAIGRLQSVANGICAVLHRRATTGDSQRAQTALAAERARLQAMMSALPDLVLEADAEGVFTGYHQTAPLTMAVAPDELLGKRPEEVLPAHLAKLARRMMAEVDRTGHAGPEGYALDLPNGQHWYTALVAARHGPAPEPPGAITPAPRHGYVFLVRDVTNEIEQRRQIEQLGAIARLTSNLVMITDADGCITWINPACVARTGYSLLEARGRWPDEILNLDSAHPDQRSGLLSALSTGTTVHTELTARDRAGRPFQLSAHARRMTSEIDGRQSFMLVAADVSNRRRSEIAQAVAAAAAEASRLQLENAVNALEDAFYYADRSQRLVMCNASLRALYPKTGTLLVPGASLHDLIAAARQHGELFSPLIDDDPATHPLLSRFNTPHYETERQTRDGRWLRIIEKATPDGGRVGMFIDISALKAAEARARRDRATALDASREGIAIVDPDGRFTYANRAMKAMFALPAAALLEGRRWSSLYPPAITHHLRATALPALRADGFWRGELSLPDDDGRVHHLSITQDSDGSALWILRDVTETHRAALEQQRLREELQTAQRREVIAQLATELAHDFNNLLNAISGSAGLIMRLDPPPETQTHAARIAMASDQATALVRRLMTLGERRANLRKIDLRNTLRDATQLLRATMRNEDLLRLQLPDTPLRAQADPTDVLQVILNLTLNARDAIASGAGSATEPSAIHVHLRRATPADLAHAFAVGRPDPARDYFCLSVRDTGPGMSENVRRQAFERSFSTKGHGGTGLGLRIVANVVTSNHGCIALDTAPGQGCTVTALWPLAQPGSGNAPRPEVSGHGDDGIHSDRALTGHTILVVDDNDAVLQVLCHDLEAAGAEVVGCASPHDALDAVRGAPQEWNLLISDERMPGMTGTALSLHLQQVAPQLPVIIISGAPPGHDERDREPPNIVGRMEKPIRSEALVAAAAAAAAPRGAVADGAPRGDRDARSAG